MDKKLVSTNHSAKVALSKSKSLLKVTKEILKIKNDEWIELLWKWADENKIEEKVIPREREDLLALRKLVVSFYEESNKTIQVVIESMLNIRTLSTLQLNFYNTSDCEFKKVLKDIKESLNIKVLNLSFSNYDMEWNDINISENIIKFKNLNTLSISCNILSLSKKIVELKKLKWINLEFCHFPNGVPLEIFNISTLEILSLASTSLKVLPKDIQKQKSLKELYLYECSMDEISIEILSLSQLEYLDLSDNNLCTIPSRIYMLKNLNNLLLDSNNLVELPNEIGNLINLEILCLDDNKLKKLPNSITKLCKLKKLTISHNPELSLTIEQKYWLEELIKQGCNISYDNNLFNQNISTENLDNNEIPF